MTQEINKNSKPKFICHELAIPAFELTQLIFLSQAAEISQHRLLLSSRANRFNYFERQGKYTFFTGWIPLLIEPNVLKKVNVYNGPSNIEFLSWLYALESIFFLSGKQHLIVNLANLFQRVPDKVKSRFFLGRVPRTLLAQLVEFSGESRASVRHSLSKMESM